MAVSLLCTSPEVLRAIVLYAVGATPLGPPHEWYSFVMCCQTLRRQLDTPAMHTLLFAQKFHVPADALHLLPTHAKPELTRRFLALKLFRCGAQCLDDPASFTDALWLAYVILRAEEPRQMNVAQLLWAGLPNLLLLFIKRRLHDGAEENHGWPLCNETNSLVIALLWLLSSECGSAGRARIGANNLSFAASVRAETPATREEVMERIRPYVLAAFRYPLTSLQEWCFASNPAFISAKSKTLFPSTKEVVYFGVRTVAVPSAPIYSILCYFTRLDTVVPMFPVHLSAAARSGAGPRPEDVEHFINECRTRFESCDQGQAALEQHLSSDDSLTRWLNHPYSPGSLTGRWKGSAIVPFINEYRHWLDDPEAPETMDTFCRHPLYLTLEEHYYYAPTPTLSPGGYAKEMTIDAWLPAAWAERDGGIEVCDDSGSTRFYETGVRNTVDTPRPDNIVDVIVTGQTDDPYATAWGAFKIFGRVRVSDGLIVLRRESVAGLGTTLLRGYMSSSQNFAGRYRAIDRGCGAAEWEAAFSLCRTGEWYD
ncbi:hypothetical protein B0H17DRAFT_306967 [Mycena rosella]|uniref:Uncharacterized protein n=1 Tax=Mycena rosella TaxID=1033263 RepID=A0AAD7GNI8_MYCRO|nr:hypothetical protein B0H17DRAFT_306967 [Mycena rosella]